MTLLPSLGNYSIMFGRRESPEEILGTFRTRFAAPVSQTAWQAYPQELFAAARNTG
jgi:hypothetical protein